MKGANDVGLDEIFGAVDGTIHMALRREVEDGTRSMLRQQLGDQLCIANIAAHKKVARIILQRCEIFEIPRVSKLVEADDRFVMFGQPIQYEICADKACAAC